jgi:hypothetical protein
MTSTSEIVSLISQPLSELALRLDGLVYRLRSAAPRGLGPKMEKLEDCATAVLEKVGRAEMTIPRARVALLEQIKARLGGIRLVAQGIANRDVLADHCERVANCVHEMELLIKQQIQALDHPRDIDAQFAPSAPGAEAATGGEPDKKSASLSATRGAKLRRLVESTRTPKSSRDGNGEESAHRQRSPS